MIDVRERPDARPWQALLAGVRQRITGSTRVWLFSAVLAALTIALVAVELPTAPPATPELRIPWWLLALAFFAAESRVVHLHIGRSAHSFSMSELPLVAGLFILSPIELVVARIIGSGVALLVVRRQAPVKAVFNTVQFTLCTVVAVLALEIAASPDPSLGPLLWVAVYVAMLAENVVGVLSVAIAISLAEGRSQIRRIPEMLSIGLIVSMTDTSIALMALTVVWVDARAVLLFVVPSVAAGVAYRAYVSERQQHESVELLFESTRILQRTPQLDQALVDLLAHARTMFRADVAEILLLPQRDGDDVLRTRLGPGERVMLMEPDGPVIRDTELVLALTERRARLVESTIGDPVPLPRSKARGGVALVAPLLGESRLIGVFVVSHRLSQISAFDLEDLRLFEALASHTAVALENGQLEQSLQRLSELKDELHHQASHDALTGLVNRVLFTELVSERLDTSTPETVPIVLFLDLDDFKVVNDSLGHAAGDALLVAVGERIRSALRADDVAARLGGDEFAVVLWDQPDMRTALGVASRLVAAMVPTFTLDGHEVTVRASIGVATGHPGTDTAGEVLRNADVAMYSAKANGKGRIVVFEPSMREAVVARAQLLADLDQAIAHQEFVLQYQPIVEMATGLVTGVEALVRWEHPTRGRIGPTTFIPIAEETDAIVEIGRWVLGEACRRARSWSPAAPGETFNVSVNVSARELARADFVDETLAIVGRAGVEPSWITLEVTETAMLRDSDAAQAKLSRLREAGFGISVDDFGTGYSSLSYLQRFPVTTLKIARDFVDVAGSNPEDWQLASAIVALGRALRMQVIAEGVEQPIQLRRLQALGCDYAQGFYFARPLDPEAIDALLGQGAILARRTDDQDMADPAPAASAAR